MKRKRTSQSAFFNLRALLGFLLCVVGLALGFVALGGWAARSEQTLAQNTARSGGGSAPISKIRAENAPVSLTQAQKAAAVAAASFAPSELRGVRPVKTTVPLRDTPPINPSKVASHSHPEPVKPADLTQSGGPDRNVQSFQGPVLSAPAAVGVAWDGVGVGLAGFAPASNPPDVNGRVGGNQYVQWNNTSFAVFNKNTGALLYGPAAGNTLFQPLGGVCATHNDGDPVVSYDIMAGRWILSQFVVNAGTGTASHQCVAVSQTGDATGAYYLYDFVTDGTNFIDYPHLAVWPDGYYMTTHVFNAAGTSVLAARVYVFERAAMLTGATARMQSVNQTADPGIATGGLAADVESLTPPPAGAQEYIIAPNGSTTNRTDLYRLAVTWGVTPTITLSAETVNTTIGLGTPTCVSNTTGRDCVPQIGAGGGANVPTDDLDSISRHYMHRLAYHNNGGTESLLVTGPTTGATTTPRHGALKWIEWRGAAGNAVPTLFQGATYDPTPTTSDYRWIPSIAMDNVGNIALGYSKSSNTTRPGIWITGRLVGDTINVMGTEALVQAGGGVQTAGAGNRWGDYTSMTLDPIDQCTFYYTNEYLKADGTFNWSTRISKYAFPTCTSIAATAYGTVTGTITSSETGAPISGVAVTLTTAAVVGNGYAGASDANGVYTIQAPVGNYTATPTDPTRNCASSTPASAAVAVTASGTLTQDFTMTGTSKLEANGAAVIDDSTGNSNGVVNKAECVKVNLPIKNNGCAKETAITATVTTSTAGVTVFDANATYPDMFIDGTASNSVPFRISTSNAFVCGTPVALSLNLTYASGSKSVAFSVPTCSGGANQSFGPYALTTSDSQQTDRLGRDGVPSTCANKFTAAGGFAGTKYYKTFTFTNTSGAARCYTVNITAALGGAGDIESAVYDQAYTAPAANFLTTNYLGDTGITGLGTTVGSTSYSITVPALHNFVVVVNTTGTTTSSTFSGTVSGFTDQTAGPGTCTYATSTSVSSNNNPSTSPDSVTFTATVTAPSGTPTGTATFKDAGSAIGSGNLVAGVATFSTSSLSVGSHSITADYSGDTTNSSSSSSTLTQIVNAPVPPVLTAAASRMMQGAGTYSISLPLSGTSGEEVRDGSGNFTIVLTFDRPVNGGTASVTGGGDVSNTAFNGSDMVVSLSGVTDQQVVTLTASNVTGTNGATLNSASVDIGFLVGDTNSDRTVNVGDTIQVRNHSGQSLDSTNFQYDLNADGQIDVGDTTVVRLKAGDSIP